MILGDSIRQATSAAWLGYFGILGSLMNVGWSVELWAGVTVMGALEGFTLSFLAVPPAVPSSVISERS